MSTSSDLAVLIAARSALISSMATGEAPVLEYEIRGKRVKFESTTSMLETLNQAIAQLTAEVAMESGVSSRNRARTRR